MSKLADKIRAASRPQSQSLGFGAARATGGATMVLAGIAGDAGAAAAVVAAGADIVVVGTASSPARPSGVDAGAPAGAWIAGSGDADAKAFKDAGFDFVIFDPDKAAAADLLEENIGYVMSVPADLSDAEIRTLEAFQLDAIYVGEIKGALTVRRQIDLRRLVAMTRKPLMAAVDAGIAPTELQALRETSVAVVMAEGAKDVEALRKTIDALPPRARRKDGDERPTPLVPQSLASAGEEHDHDDDE